MQSSLASWQVGNAALCAPLRHDTVPYQGQRELAIRSRIKIQRAGMEADDDGTGQWIEAGLAELAEGGIDRVRVEVVAERLGVTKGGFYRRFKDRRALV